VDRARAEGVQTSGARNGGAVAEFLTRPDDAPARNESDAAPPERMQPVDAGLLDSLTKR